MSDTNNESVAATVSGRAVVTGFLAVGVVVIATATGLRFSNREKIQEAQVKAMPTLATEVQVDCVAPGQPPVRIQRRANCPLGSAIRLTSHAPAAGTQSVLYALASPVDVVVGKLPAEQPVTVAAENGPAGPRTLAVLLVAAPMEPDGLRAAADAIPTGEDLFGRLARLESYVTTLRNGGTEARAERFDFQRVAPQP